MKNVLFAPTIIAGIFLSLVGAQGEPKLKLKRIPLLQSVCEEPEITKSIGSDVPGKATRLLQDALDESRLRVADLEKKLAALGPKYKNRLKEASEAWNRSYFYSPALYPPCNNACDHPDGSILVRASLDVNSEVPPGEATLDWAKHILRKGVSRPKNWGKEDRRYDDEHYAKRLTAEDYRRMLDYFRSQLKMGSEWANPKTWQRTLEAG